MLRWRRGREGRRRGRGVARSGRLGSEHVLEAARVLRAALAPHLHRDWSVRAGDLTWSCQETLLHAVDVWYAVELASQCRACFAWRAGLAPEEGLAAHDAATALLAAVLRGVPPESRGYHGQPTDAEGFAAMHCDEVLVYGYDYHTTRRNLPGILRGSGKTTYALPAHQACFGLFSGMFTALPYVIAR